MIKTWKHFPPNYLLETPVSTLAEFKATFFLLSLWFLHFNFLKTLYVSSRLKCQCHEQMSEKREVQYMINLTANHKLWFPLFSSLHNVSESEDYIALLNLFATIKCPSLSPINKFAALALRGMVILLLLMSYSVKCV